MPYHIGGRKRDPRIPIKHNEVLEHLDGDPKKLTLIDDSPDGRFPVNFSLGKSGRAVDATHMPTRFRRKGNKGLPMYEVDNAWGGGLIVTDKFRKIVESFEPAVHQFFPIQIEQGGKVIVERFIFYICNRLDSLAKEYCSPQIGPDEFYNPIHDGNDKIVFASSQIMNVSAWCDRFTVGRYVSDELFASLASENFTGFGFKQYDEI